MLSKIFNLPDRVRLIVIAVMVIVVLALISIEIASKERIIRDGTTILLRLAPRDPRSLIQGDYMALRYTMATTVAREAENSGLNDGQAVIVVDEQNQASFLALYSGQTLETGQHLLRYRKRGDSVRLASDAYFFEEGSWQDYRDARFGEVRIDEKGEAVLTGLLNTSRERLGAKLH